MTTKELQKKIIEAYSTENLNKISLTLINLYKEQKFSSLQLIAEMIDDAVDIEITSTGKGFSKFMMLYHPDRATFHLNEIERLAEKDDYDGLLGYSHILLLSRIDEIAGSLNNYEDIDYSPVYEWDLDTEGFSIIDDTKAKKHFNTKPATNGLTFYDAIKVRVFEDTNIEYPSYYLEDTDEFELSASDIDDLDGVQFCIHARSIDLSDNKISDLSLLFGLSLLEELNLSDNLIENIDVLSNLLNIKVLYLSNNNIDDISPLLELPKLEYVDLTGTSVSKLQIDKLAEGGILVDK